jgi:GNAT superfamily N-acetyltransferase
LDDGTVVGELRAHEFDDAVDGAAAPCVTVPRGTVVLDGVVVAARWRRLGIGRRLVGALRDEVTMAVVTLATGNHQRLFLQRCGFGPARDLSTPRWLVSRPAEWSSYDAG